MDFGVAGVASSNPERKDAGLGVSAQQLQSKKDATRTRTRNGGVGAISVVPGDEQTVRIERFFSIGSVFAFCIRPTLTPKRHCSHSDADGSGSGSPHPTCEYQPAVLRVDRGVKFRLTRAMLKTSPTDDVTCGTLSIASDDNEDYVALCDFGKSMGSRDVTGLGIEISGPRSIHLVLSYWLGAIHGVSVNVFGCVVADGDCAAGGGNAGAGNAGAPYGADVASGVGAGAAAAAAADADADAARIMGEARGNDAASTKANEKATTTTTETRAAQIDKLVVPAIASDVTSEVCDEKAADADADASANNAPAAVLASDESNGTAEEKQSKKRKLVISTATMEKKGGRLSAIGDGINGGVKHDADRHKEEENTSRLTEDNGESLGKRADPSEPADNEEVTKERENKNKEGKEENKGEEQQHEMLAPMTKKQRRKLAKQKAQELANVLAENRSRYAGSSAVDVAKPQSATQSGTNGKKKAGEGKKAAQSSSSPPPPQTKQRRLDGGILVSDIIIGTGPTVKEGRKVAITYEGAFLDGTVFDRNKSKKRPMEFRPGTGEVIRGLERGLDKMKVGGERVITVPPEMGYGKKGSGDVIPGNATLVFTVQLRSVGGR